MRGRCIMRNWLRFLEVIPHSKAGFSRVTLPFATLLGIPGKPVHPFAYDLHESGTPPTFVLSQDHTLRMENSSNLTRPEFPATGSPRANRWYSLF
jgi:hypothetical protein